MTDVKWIKIVTDIFDDEKMLIIESMPESDSIIVVWFKLLCLAGKQNNSGVFLIRDRIAYTDEMFAAIFRRPVNTIRLALKTFESLGMIEIINGAVTIPNWEKHQKLDAFEISKAATRNRVAKFREKQKLLACGNVTGNVTGNATVTPVYADVTQTDIDIEGDIDKDKDKEIDIDRDKSTVRKRTTPARFTKPTIEEIREFCNENGYRIDAQRFVDYYESCGWVIGKGKPMKDWKAAVRMWASRDSGNASSGFARGGKSQAQEWLDLAERMGEG